MGVATRHTAPVPNLYVRPVPGRLVTRFGSSQYIGAIRPFPHPTQAAIDAGESPVRWDPAVVVLIPEAEANRYLREYTSAIRHGDLVRATEAEHVAYLASLDEQENS